MFRAGVLVALLALRAFAGEMICDGESCVAADDMHASRADPCAEAAPDDAWNYSLILVCILFMWASACVSFLGAIVGLVYDMPVLIAYLFILKRCLSGAKPVDPRTSDSSTAKDVPGPLAEDAPVPPAADLPEAARKNAGPVVTYE